MKSQFTIGQSVKSPSFVNCFGELVPEVSNLVVEQIRLIEGQSIPDYYRIKAIDRTQPAHFVEAAERFFVAE